MNAQDTFGIVAVFYAVSNLASLGLELDLRERIQSLRSVRVLGLTLGWRLIPGLTVSSLAIGKPLLPTVLLPVIVWFFRARFFASRAGKTAEGELA